MSMTHPSVEIQTSPDSVPALPEWFGEVSLFARYLTHLGVLDALSQRVRVARGRMGTYDPLDFVAVLLGYAVSGEPTLQAFSERLQPFAPAFMALFGREHLPHRSSLSRFLAALEPGPVEALRTLCEEDVGARDLPDGTPRGLWDRQGQQWHVFDVDGTRMAARQRALPTGEDLPPSRRRLSQVTAPGYRGHKRGEAVRTRTVVQEASTQRFLGTFGGAGNGDYRGELRRALRVVQSYGRAQSLDPHRIVVRLDGLYGDGVVVGDIASEGCAWLLRGRDYALLAQPAVQALLAVPPSQEHTQTDSGLVRQLFDCVQVPLTVCGPRSRVIIARHAAPPTPPAVGVLREGQVYELFYTALPPQGFRPADVLELYFQRGGFESSLADEDQEQDADRWCSATPWGQEGWQIVAQWVWNLRIELGQLAQPTPLRTTALAEALAPEDAATVAAPAQPEVRVEASEAVPQAGRPADPARKGLFGGQDFAWQEDGTLRCPANAILRERERRRQADGSLRLFYAAPVSQCRACALRAQCLRRNSQKTQGRRVSVVVGITPTLPPPSVTGPPAQLASGTAPLLWRDWPRRAGRRAWMQGLRRQQVSLTLLPAPPPGVARASPAPPLTRAQRAHRRLSWTQRLSRNAVTAEHPQVRIQLWGIAPALAQALGLAS
jgi:hypothetical protein